MKILTLIFAFIAVATTTTIAKPKDPIVIEAITKHKSIEDALVATKGILLAKKFITQEMQAKSFTATRTTGSKADYFVADVSASEADGKIKITVTFVKVGSGFLSLKKVAEDVKKQLEE